jgi:hypothetical protein
LDVLDDFFEEYPELRELRYGGRKLQATAERRFAGLGESWLPALEVALFTDVGLHEEFVTIRLRSSILTLVPEHVLPQRRSTSANAAPRTRASWPDIQSIPLYVRNSVLTIVFEVMYVYCSPLYVLVIGINRNKDVSPINRELAVLPWYPGCTLDRPELGYKDQTAHLGHAIESLIDRSKVPWVRSLLQLLTLCLGRRLIKYLHYLGSEIASCIAS